MPVNFTNYKSVLMKKYTCIAFFLLANTVFAEIWLPTIISDNMVLQQNSNANIWGWTTVPSEKITVIGSWNDKEITVEAFQGIWSLQLPTPVAGGSYTIIIKGHETITLQNILIGEVWLASGQSNMEWTPTMGLDKADEEIKNATYPNIRFFTVAKHKSESPQDNTKGHWVTCSPETMKDFSSVAYFFGRKLHKNLSVPIGLINSSWGGTPVEVWIPKALYNDEEELKGEVDKLTEYAWWPKDPGLAYNSMIHPISKFDIAGAIWYQGESNRENAFTYTKSFSLMIESWRDLWQKEFPFYFVQIAPFNYNSLNNLGAAVLRDAQLQTMLSVPQSGMVVTNDIGNLKNIHPTNKQAVGKRLALWALAKTYGVKDISFSGPIYKSMEVQKKKIVIHFDFAEEGLVQKGKSLKEFYIAGADQVFHRAEAKIKGESIIVSSKEVTNPKAVRFAYTDTAQPNLFNAAGLPASAFRTDNWEIKIKTN